MCSTSPSSVHINEILWRSFSSFFRMKKLRLGMNFMVNIVFDFSFLVLVCLERVSSFKLSFVLEWHPRRLWHPSLTSSSRYLVIQHWRGFGMSILFKINFYLIFIFCKNYRKMISFFCIKFTSINKKLHFWRKYIIHL